MFRVLAKRLSASLAKHPALVFRAQQVGLRFASRALDLDMASWVIRRPEWLGRGSANARPLDPGALESTVALALGKRIQASYGPHLAAIQPEGDPTIWDSIRDVHLAGLRQALAGESETFVDFAGSLFRTSAVNGFSYGSTFDPWPHRWHYLPVQIELSVVTLAEYLGIVRAECPEQGERAAWTQQFTEEGLISALEKNLGVRIEHPRIGNPRGTMFGGRFIARETCSHLYAAHRMKALIDAEIPNGPVNVVEIGGGYGGTCHWLRQLLGARMGRYAIVDLPEVSAIQAVFLGDTLGGRVSLPGETSNDATVRLLLTDELGLLGFEPDVAINQDSLPEMPRSEALRYLDWIGHSAARLFLSFNQEAFAHNGEQGLQNWVPELASLHKEFFRFSRETSWDRRGYVEEGYRVSRTGP